MDTDNFRRHRREHQKQENGHSHSQQHCKGYNGLFQLFAAEVLFQPLFKFGGLALFLLRVKVRRVHQGLHAADHCRQKIYGSPDQGHVKSNSALIRKRLRDTRLKVEEYKIGVRSHTLTQVLYMDDLVHEGLLEEVKERLEEFQIDGILDSGMLEQLTEDVWYSPFPQYQTTERPDRAVQEILKGKVVILCDNSPEALFVLFSGLRTRQRLNIVGIKNPAFTLVPPALDEHVNERQDNDHTDKEGQLVIDEVF